MYQPQWQQERCPITIESLALTCSCHKGTCKNVVDQDWLVFQCTVATANACDNKKFNMF